LLFDEDGLLSSVFCYVIKDEGFEEYVGDTEKLCGLSKGDDSKEVVAKLRKADLRKLSSAVGFKLSVASWCNFMLPVSPPHRCDC